MKRTVLGVKGILLSLLLGSSSVWSAVQVTINQQDFSYEQAPRLAEVLAPVALTSEWYWPASRVFRINTQAPTTGSDTDTTPNKTAEQVQVIAFLQQLALDTNAKERAIFIDFARYVASWRIAQRIAIPVDYDLARANPQFNPRLDPGRYIVNIEARPDYVLLMGAVTATTTLRHQAVSSVQDYPLASHLLDNADHSKVFIIQPDGKIVEAGKQNWNAGHVEVMPGSVIFVPFATGVLSSQVAELNTLLLALVVNRVY